MATMIPNLSDNQLAKIPSKAEVKLYLALRNELPADYLVFFEVGWILHQEDDQATDGETDFLVCHPKYGYLCIEVKGGGICYDGQTAEWSSIDRQGIRHVINDPIKQALKAKYSINKKLNEQQRWQALRHKSVMCGHTVFFPDIANSKFIDRADMPQLLIGCSRDLLHIKEWIETAFDYWGANSISLTPIGKEGMEVMRDVFARSFVAAPLKAAQLQDQESQRLRLTQEQVRVLDFLRSHRRAAISGGAGTGKTVLAVEKARRLAAEGFHTLLTCYNRPLADHLAQVCASIPNLEVMGFHQLCYRRIQQASLHSKRDLVLEAQITYPGKDLYDVQLPNALAFSLDIISDGYDAIVCDEGQDFREEFWVPIELLLVDFEKSPLYIFFDDNQNIYKRVSSFPIQEQPYSLTINCRNTPPIHKGAYKYYKGLPVSPADIQGDEIQYDSIMGFSKQAARITSRIVDLIAKQNVSPGDITVLVADASHKMDYYKELKQHPLPKPAMWFEEGICKDNFVLVDTIQRFKGLESNIVILWGLDTIDLSKHGELLYVGMSRAKSILIVVANPETCHYLENQSLIE